MDENAKDKTINTSLINVSGFGSSTPLNHNAAKKRFGIPELFSPVVEGSKIQVTSKIPRIIRNGVKKTPTTATVPSQPADQSKENVITGAKHQRSDDHMMIVVSDDDFDDEIFGAKKKKDKKKVEKKALVISNSNSILKKQKNNAQNKKRPSADDSDSDDSPPKRSFKVQKVNPASEVDLADDEGSDDQQVLNQTFDLPSKKPTKTIKPAKTTKNSPSKATSKPIPIKRTQKTSTNSPAKSKPILKKVASPSYSPAKKNQEAPHTPTKPAFITKKDLFLHSPRASDIQIKSPSKKAKSILEYTSEANGRSPLKISPAKVAATKSAPEESARDPKSPKVTKTRETKENSDNDSILGIRPIPTSSTVALRPATRSNVGEKQLVQYDEALPGSSSEFNYPPISTYEMRIAGSDDESIVEMAAKKTSPKRKRIATKLEKPVNSPKKREPLQKMKKQLENIEVASSEGGRDVLPFKITTPTRRKLVINPENPIISPKKKNITQNKKKQPEKEKVTSSDDDSFILFKAISPKRRQVATEPESPVASPKKKELTQNKKKQPEKPIDSKEKASISVNKSKAITSSFSDVPTQTPDKKSHKKKKKRTSFRLPSAKRKAALSANKSTTPQKSKITKQIQSPKPKVINKSQTSSTNSTLVPEEIPKKKVGTKSVAKKTTGKIQIMKADSELSGEEPMKSQGAKCIAKKTTGKKQIMKADSELSGEEHTKSQGTKRIAKKTTGKKQIMKAGSELSGEEPMKSQGTKRIAKKTTGKKQIMKADSELSGEEPMKSQGTKHIAKKATGKKQIMKAGSELSEEDPTKSEGTKSVAKKTTGKKQTMTNDAEPSEKLIKRGKSTRNVKETASKNQAKKRDSMLSSEDYQAIYTNVFGSNVDLNATESSVNITVLEAKKRKSDSPAEEVDGVVRRSKRMKTPRLAFWEGEKIKVLESEKGEEQYEFVIPATVGKPKQKKETTKSQSKVHPSVNKFLQRMAAPMDRDEPGQPTQNDDSSMIPDTTIKLALDPEQPHVQTQCQIITHVQDMHPLSKSAGTEKQDDGVRYATTLQCPWLECGFMRLNPGAKKGRQISHGRVLTFMLHSSQVEVEINGNKSMLSFGYTFVVPPGVVYNITNCGNQPALLSIQSILNPSTNDK